MGIRNGGERMESASKAFLQVIRTKPCFVCLVTKETWYGELEGFDDSGIILRQRRRDDLACVLVLDLFIPWSAIVAIGPTKPAFEADLVRQQEMGGQQ
jgi:hypothetical protein